MNPNKHIPHPRYKNGLFSAVPSRIRILGILLVLAMIFITVGCDSIVDQKSEADAGIATRDMAGDFLVGGTTVECIDPTILEYNKVLDSKTVEWGNKKNPFTKTVDIEYYNTLSQFVLRVKSTQAIADVLKDDQSIKNFDGKVAVDTWQEFTFELGEDWQAGDEWAFEVEVAGSGPPVDFEVDYTLVGECIFHTLSLAVNPEGAGTVTGGDEYEKDDVAALEATANEGWVFVNWTDGADTEISTSANFNYTMPDTDVTLTANYVTWLRDTQTTVVDVLNPITGKTWMDRNLGASRAATASDDSEAYGDLFQWGRAADGHQKRSSATTNTLSSSDQPNHGNFILTDSSPYDWRTPQNNNLWKVEDGINNPCPIGYRLPTSAEWEAERLSWSSNNSAGAFASPLKLPAPGRRIGTNGWLVLVDSGGFYWSDTVNGSEAWYLYFDSSTSREVSYRRARGLSVRCIKG